jgi:hypothetical protein
MTGHFIVHGRSNDGLDRACVKLSVKDPTRVQVGGRSPGNVVNISQFPLYLRLYAGAVAKTWRPTLHLGLRTDVLEHLLVLGVVFDGIVVEPAVAWIVEVSVTAKRAKLKACHQEKSAADQATYSDYCASLH